MRRAFAVLFLLAAVPLFAGDADVARIGGAILVGGHSMQYERELTDRFGPRLIGTQNYDRAAEWAAAQFRAAGVANVRLEPAPLVRGWERGTSTAKMTAPYERTLHLTPFAWTDPTPAGGIRGEVVSIGDLSPEAVRARAQELDGRVVLLPISALFRDYFGQYSQYLAGLDAMKQAGARGVLIGMSTADNVTPVMQATWSMDVAPPLPMAELGMEDAKLLERLTADGRVSIEYSYDARYTPAHTLHNVVAEIRGSETPDEWIAVGAHLDSWDVAAGAQDNATGCAMVLEAARAIAASGRAPRRSIRFFLWAGEEEGYLGSRAYATAHAAELPKCVAMLNADAGAGHPRGWSTMGRGDVAEALRPLSAALLTELGGATVTEGTEFILQSDHTFFLLAGVPILELRPDMSKYFDIHHRSSDTIEKIDPHNLADNAAIVAVTAFAIADRDQRLAPQLDADGVARILQKSHADTFAKQMGWMK